MSDSRRGGQLHRWAINNIMNSPIFISLIAAGISGGSLVVAIISLRRALSAERRALAEAKTNAFLVFRQRFTEIKHDLPAKYSHPVWLPEPNTDEWRQIELYWQNAFDEWFVPTVLNKDYLEEVWEIFFKDAVKSGLQHRPLRYVAYKLYEQGEFANHKVAFKKTLQALWGGSLRDKDFE
jgi:hypothetical protein